jgi:hypothetical protein
MSMPPDTQQLGASAEKRVEIMKSRRKEKLRHDLMNNLNGSMINGTYINESNIQDAL